MAPVPADWSAVPLNCVLMSGAAVFAMFQIRDLVEIAPYLFRGLTRDKTLIETEDNLHLRQERNMVALAAKFFFCLMAARLGFLSFGLKGAAATLATLGSLAVYSVLRRAASAALERKAGNREAYRASFGLFDNFITVLAIVAGATLWAGSLPGSDPESIRMTFLNETVVAAAIFVLRKSEILFSFCNPLKAFLYLCTLELIPAGILVAAAVLF